MLLVSGFSDQQGPCANACHCPEVAGPSWRPIIPGGRAGTADRIRCQPCGQLWGAVMRQSLPLPSVGAQRDRAVVVTLVAEDVAAVHLGLRILRIDFDRLGEVGDGAVAVATLSPVT